MNEAEGWVRGLDAVAERLAPRFVRAEARRRAVAYWRGLLAPVARKNGWQLAEAAGDRTPDGVQAFLSRMRRDAEAVRDDLRSSAVEHRGDPEAVLVLDATGFVKKGTKSVGVQRQYSGTAGRIENCQIGLFLGYASRYGHALIARALYLPEGWAGDPSRRSEAGVPAEVAFTTKPKLARAMPARAHAAGVPFAWVTADSVYGADYALRRWLQDRSLGSALAVTGAQRLGLSRGDELAGEVPAGGWHRLSAGEGSKGPRLDDWAYAADASDAAAGWEKGLLARRKLDEPDALTFHLTHAPEGTALAALVPVAGSRWTIEACFEAATGEVGLDQYEVRSWTGWHRHVTLAMLAHAYLAVVRAVAVGGRGPARLGRGAAAAHRAGGAAAALEVGLGASARPRRRPGLVTLAPTPPAARPPLPLATPDPPA